MAIVFFSVTEFHQDKKFGETIPLGEPLFIRNIHNGFDYYGTFHAGETSTRSWVQGAANPKKLFPVENEQLFLRVDNIKLKTK